MNPHRKLVCDEILQPANTHRRALPQYRFRLTAPD
jgi:hypothetical protein